MTSSTRWGAFAAGAALLSAGVAFLVAGIAADRYAREHARRTGSAIAAYLSLVTPRARAPDGGYELSGLLVQTRALATFPTFSQGIEVYHRTAPLVSATAPALQLDAYESLRRGRRHESQRWPVLVALKDRTDSIVVGAVAVARRPNGPSRVSVVLVAGVIVTVLSAWWAFRTTSAHALVAYAAIAVAFAAIGGVHVRDAARYSVNGWLVDTRLLIQEVVARSPGGRVTTANLARIAGDATVHASTETTLEPRRASTPDGEAAVVAVRLAAWRWLELRYTPAAPRTGHWFLTLILLSAAGPALTAMARWGARSRIRPRELHETAAAWAFLAPATLHLAAFALAPMLFLVYLSLHRWRVGDAVKPFIGLANFALLGDPAVWRSLGITAVFALHVPVTMAVALAAAIVLRRERGSRPARLVMAALLLPTMASVVAVAVVWQWIYGHSADAGLINRWLMIAGQSPIDWLGDGATALLALMIVAAWLQVGWQTWVLLAGLEAIPAAYMDLARVDGARSWQRFRHVTLPLLRPVLLVVLVTGLLGAFQMFTLVFVITDGGPAHATNLIAYRIYQTAWGMGRFGLASALALVLFALLLGFAWMQFRLVGRRMSGG